MRELSQAFWGMLAALFSTILVLGGLMMSLAEGGLQAASVAEQSPTLTMTVPTQRSGEPTYTPSPTTPPTPTPTAVRSNVCQYPEDWVEVFVDFGDDFSSLAFRYGISVENLRLYNCLDMRALMPGMTVFVPPLPPTPTAQPSLTPALPVVQPSPTRRYCPRPPGWVDYYVKRGDTLFSISSARGITYQVLMARNCLNTIVIRVGQRLFVPNVPVIPPSLTPAPYISPTFPPPATWTSVPPTAVIPSATSTTVPATSTPVILPTDTTLPPTWTATATPIQPAPTLTPTVEPTTPVAPTATPLPSSTATLPPPPSNTPTSIPLPTDTPASRITTTTEANPRQDIRYTNAY
jgi:LysM repeat protein